MEKGIPVLASFLHREGVSLKSYMCTIYTAYTVFPRAQE